MYYRFVRTPTDEEHNEPERVREQEVGRVAERAHIVLLSVREYTISDICTIFEVVDEAVYNWFDRFDERGPPGLYEREREERPPELDADDEAEIEWVLERSPEEQGYGFSTWTVPLIFASNKGILLEHRRRIWHCLGVDVVQNVLCSLYCVIRALYVDILYVSRRYPNLSEQSPLNQRWH